MRISRIVLLTIGVIVVVVAAIWRPVVAPSLTKLPTSLNDSVAFTGTYTGYVNQTTGAPLAAPQRVPLTIARHVQAVPGESTSSVLVVNDDSAITIGTAKSSAVLQYALDRSTEKDVASPHAYSLVPANVVNRAGAYSLGVPPGADPGTSYQVWIDQVGKSIPLTSEHGSGSVDGVGVQEWQDNLPPTVMTASTDKAMGLAASMPFAAFEAEVAANGTDLAADFKALSPSLSATEQASLAALTAAPIPLQYLYATHSVLQVEPTTGATVDVIIDVQSFAVRPDLSGLAAGLTPILTAHASNPAAAKLIAASKQLASVQAQPLYTLSFQQTPASVSSVSKTASTDATLLNVINIWIPVALGVIGLILIGLSFLIRGRRRGQAGPVPDAPVSTDPPVSADAATSADAPVAADAPKAEAEAETAAEAEVEAEAEK